jgi:hypothetical protein
VEPTAAHRVGTQKDWSGEEHIGPVRFVLSRKEGEIACNCKLPTSFVQQTGALRQAIGNWSRLAVLTMVLVYLLSLLASLRVGRELMRPR